MFRVCRYEWCWLCGSTYTSLHYVNPFGCMGLQAGGHTAKNWGWCKRFFYRLGIILGMLIALPFAVVFGFPVFLCSVTTETRCYRRYIRHTGCCIKFLFHALLMFPLGMLLNVIVVPLAIVALPFILLGILIQYCIERQKLKKRSQELLKRHRENN